MRAVRIKKHIDSDTLHLPELSSMIGKDVNIIIIEEHASSAFRQDLAPLFDLAGKIDLDSEAIDRLRKISMI